MDDEAKLRVIIVDDEEPARQILHELLSQRDDVQIVAQCRNGYEAVKACGDQRPDLVFLDIQMPKLSGFEVLELIGTPAPAVVFVTAFDEHAVRAFEVHALDYLLKPFTAERLEAALTRARAGVGAAMTPRQIERAARASTYLERVLVREGDKIHVIACDKIDFIEARDDEVLIVTATAKHRKAERLSDLENDLDPRLFVRIHRSFLLNLDRLARLELYAKDSRVAFLHSGLRLPVSRAGYARLRELL